MYKIILRSSEAKNIVLNHYLSAKNSTFTIPGDIMIEQNSMEVATEIFQLLLKKNLVTHEHVEFSSGNITKREEKKSPNVDKTKETHAAKKDDTGAKNETKTMKDIIFDYICEISPKRVTVKELVDKLGLNYQSTATTLKRLVKEDKVEKDTEKRYFKKETSIIVVEEVKKEEPNAGVTTNLTPDESDAGKQEAEPEKQEEVVPEVTLVEKAKAMQTVFSNENNKDILNYIFFKKKNNFEVKKLRETFGHAEAENISKIISLLADNQIIEFNEKLPPEGRYVIHPIGRMYANLLRNKEPIEEGALRVASEIGLKDFQKLMDEALKAEIVTKTVAKRVTRYAVKEL